MNWRRDRSKAKKWLQMLLAQLAPFRSQLAMVSMRRSEDTHMGPLDAVSV